jgi:hypothetical protein
MRSVYFSSNENDRAEAEALGFGFILDEECPAPFALIQGPATGDLILHSPVDAEAASEAIVQNAAAEAQIALDTLRGDVAAAITVELVKTDAWCARHVEDGVSLTPERRAYRAQLRALLGDVETMSEDELRGFEIPPMPSWSPKETTA